MYFPTSQQISAYYGAFLVTGPILLLISVGLWIWLIRAFRQVPRPSIDFRVLIFALGTLVIGSGHLLIYRDVTQAIQWQHQLTDVQEVHITPLVREYASPSGNTTILTDQTEVRRGLRLLTAAAARTRNHEGFSDGYRIRIVLKAPNQNTSRYLSVFRTSNGTRSVAVVMVLSPSSVAGVAEFSSPEFLAWLDKTVSTPP